MEVISPWTLYWILQLDTIGMAASMVAFMGLVGFVGVAFLLTEVKTRLAILAYVAYFAIWSVCAMAAIFLPSTKTMAAIVVIPAIANSEAVQAEAGELYDLAKQALRNAVGDDDKPEAE